MAKPRTNIDRINRDNFDTAVVLEWIEEGLLPEGESNRLLLEACHVIARKRHVIAFLRKEIRTLYAVSKQE